MVFHARAALFFLSLLLLPSVFAVGFGDLPSNREVIFRPDTEVKVSFYVINGDHIRVTASTTDPTDPTTKGTPDDNNMLQYVTVEDPAPETGQRLVSLVFRFPQHAMRPGTYNIDVFATDVPPQTDTATVSAVATVKFRMVVWVLSPDPVVSILGINVPPIAEGLQANATVSYISRTEQDLSGVLTVVDVRDKAGAVLATATGAPRSLLSGKSDSVTMLLPTEQFVGGEYDVYATVHYVDKEAHGGPNILKIGTLHVSIPSYTKELRYNETNRFRFNVTNQWNRELQDVYTNVYFGTQQKKTASLNIPPFGQTEYEIYFDRDDSVPVGPAVVNVTVTFNDYDTRSAQYVGKLESFALPVQITVPAIEEQPLSLRDALTWGLGVAVLCLLALLLVVARRREPPTTQTGAPPSAKPPL